MDQPSVYPNADTFTATAAEGISYSLDAMDSDVLSRLTTKSGPLVLIPYPVVTVDMGQYLQRSKDPRDMERLWIERHIRKQHIVHLRDRAAQSMLVEMAYDKVIEIEPSARVALRLSHGHSPAS